MLYIRYQVYFLDNNIQTFIDSSSEISIIIPTYTAKLGLIIQKPSIKDKKIYSLLLEIYDMTSTILLLWDN